MEIELKYKIPSPEIADEIWKDKLFFHMEEDESREEICLNAKYYDTQNGDLAKNEIAYRVRKEGCRFAAALKWKGHSEGALHMREEINVPVADDKPLPEVFRESEIGGKLLEMIDGKPLYCMLETKVHRKQFRIDTGSGIFELSLDQGWIITPYGEDIISEVELELFSGETEELEKLGQALREKYSLEKEERSKYARGMEIIERSGKETNACGAPSI